MGAVERPVGRSRPLIACGLGTGSDHLWPGSPAPRNGPAAHPAPTRAARKQTHRNPSERLSDVTRSRHPMSPEQWPIGPVTLLLKRFARSREPRATLSRAPRAAPGARQLQPLGLAPRLRGHPDGAALAAAR